MANLFSNNSKRYSMHQIALAASVASAAVLVQVSGVPVAGFGSTAAYAFSGDVTLENLTIKDKESVTVIRRVDVVNSNLEKSEIAKLFEPSTKGEEAAAIFAKLKASKLSIPEIQLSGKDGFKGSIREIVATDIDQGKIAKLSISGFEGGDKAAKGPTNLKIGSILMEGADLSKLLEAARTGKPPEADNINNTMDRLSIGPMEMTLPDDKTPKDAPGGNFTKIRIAGVEGIKDKSVLPAQRGTFEIKNFSIELPKASNEAKQLAAFGYDKLDMGIKLQGTMDEAKKQVVIDDLTISGVNIGALGLKAQMGNYTKPAAGADQNAKVMALMTSDISSAQLSFANTGVFEKSVAFLAKQQNKKPEDLKAEWSAISGAMLPALLGGDPAGKIIGDAVAKFIASPRNITIAAKAKNGAVKIMDLQQIKSPQELLAKIDISANANQ